MELTRIGLYLLQYFLLILIRYGGLLSSIILVCKHMVLMKYFSNSFNTCMQIIADISV
jgi:hypothetical protein